MILVGIALFIVGFIFFIYVACTFCHKGCYFVATCCPCCMSATYVNQISNKLTGNRYVGKTEGKAGDELRKQWAL